MTASGRTALLLAAFFCLAANLRAPIVAVGPVLQDIGAALQMKESALGLLGTLPVLAFAAVSPFVHRLAFRFGLERAMLLGLTAMLAGTLLRISLPSVAVLMAGTFILCGGIAVGNVLLSAAIRRDFPNHMEKMSSFQMFAFGIFQTMAAACAVPLAHAFGWKTAISIWTLAAIPALLLWPQIARQQRQYRAAAAQPALLPAKNIWKSPLAWKISLYMGLQSMLYYTLVNWMPQFLHHRGLTESQAGNIMALFQIVTIPTVIAITPLAERCKNMTILLVGAGLVILLGVLGLWMLPIHWAWLPAIIAGSGGAAAFTFCLMLYAMRGKNAIETAALSGMSQTVGYLIAAAGPVLLGKLLESSGGWGLPWIAVCAIAAAIALTGVLAGQKGGL